LANGKLDLPDDFRIPRFQDVDPLADEGGWRVPEMAAKPQADQLTRVSVHAAARFSSIHRWLPKACLWVESSAEENVVL